MVTQFNELTDSQWEIISPLFNIQRKRKNSLRNVINAIFFILRTGSQWRNLPQLGYPKWQSVYYYFYKWTHDNTIESLNFLLNSHIRKQTDREVTPSLGCIDSQSVKIAPMIFEDKGIDGNKKINGRKRQVMVDTCGLVWASNVHAANLSDTDMGCSLLEKINGKLLRLQKLLVDAGYRGTFQEQAKQQFEITVEISSRPPSEKGFVPIAKRWVSERTFGWFNFFRRLSKDYEHSTRCAESMLLLANCAIIINRITL
ncbi:MAG TPA: IS5 family transposase [Bacteroidales bacterium]